MHPDIIILISTILPQLTYAQHNKQQEIQAAQGIKEIRQEVIKEERTQCGMPIAASDKYILGGKEIQKGQFPWMVLIDYDSLDPEGNIVGTGICGGSIIDHDYVLTAAHCFGLAGQNFKNYKISAGIVNKNDEDVSKHEAEIIMISESFNKTSDVGLLKVKPPFKYQSEGGKHAIGPICLPKSYLPFDSGILIALGFGIHKNNKTGKFEHPDKSYYQPLRVDDKCPEIPQDDVNNPSFICTKTNKEESPEGFCAGDSGGGVVAKDEKTGAFTIYGVVSRGINEAGKIPTTTKMGEYCSLDETFTALTNVYYYLDWIKETIKNSF